MKQIKKCLMIILSFIIVFSFSGCGADDSLVNNNNSASNQSQQVSDANAKKTYEKLTLASNICINGMDDIYGAWYFGIYDADDCYTSNVVSKLALKTSFTSSQIESYLEDSYYTKSMMIYGVSSLDISAWQVCVGVIQGCLTARGDFDKCDEYLAEAKSLLKTYESTSYPYYNDLRTYYTKVSAYIEFFKSPDCSFNQLVSRINDYESGIKECKQNLSFIFDD